ncbi:MAG: hypothetical protein DI629_03385 [Mesorhizobium amorphae]|nr:MAG: hypothetical protein DI629_03385 [Mesorhizobium amorphae]
MQEPELFRPGDEVAIPFLIVAGGAIVNLSDGVLTAEVRAGTKLKGTLAEGSGITIERATPAAASGSAEQEAHGLVTIDEALSAQLPVGIVSRIVFVFTTSAGLRLSVEDLPLRGRP